MAWTLTFPEQHGCFMPGPDQEKKVKLFDDLIARYGEDSAMHCLQVGVPSWMDKKWGCSFVAIDLYDKRPIIDYRVDLSATGFASDGFDLILCNAILEHVKDPFACVEEMHRILKPGALVWSEIPFVQPYHPYKTYQLSHGYLPVIPDDLMADEDHGGDYWRFTPQGLRLLFKKFDLIEMMCIDDGGIVFYGSKR